VQAEIARLLAGSGLQTTIECKIAVQQRANGRYTLELELLRPVTGERRITHTSCASAAHAAALVVAISVDPDALSRHDEHASGDASGDASGWAEPASTPPKERAAADEPVQGTTPKPPPAADVAVDEQRASSREQDPTGGAPFTLAVGAAVERGLLPTWTPGPFVGLGLQGQHWRVSLHGALFPRSRAFLYARETGAELSALWVELDACARWGEPVRLGICGFARHVWLSAFGFGVDEGEQPQIGLQVLGAGPLLSFTVYGGVALEAGVQLEAPLARPRFVIENIDSDVFQVKRVGVAARINGSVSF
jgi:hypothetical protein